MNAFERARILAHQRLRKFVSGDSAEHTPDKTLVIVDMQDYFLSGANGEMVDSTCDLITHARINEWGIILVEFRNLGDTTRAILDAVSGHEHLETVKKDTESGGREVAECLSRHPKWSTNILICGLYGDACVPATVAGIFDHHDLVEIDVVTDLVYPDYESDDEDGQREREVETMSLGLHKSLVV